MNATGLIIAEDMAIAISGAFNTGYFARYLLRGYLLRGYLLRRSWLRVQNRHAKRTAAAALLLVGIATATEAAFSQGILHAHDQLVALGSLSEGLWALARLPLLLATAFITAIIVRKISPNDRRQEVEIAPLTNAKLPLPFRACRRERGRE